MLHTKFQAPEPSSSGKEDSEVYFISEPKTPPTRRAIADPRATIRINLVEVHKAMLHTKYQGPRPSGFRGDVV